MVPSLRELGHDPVAVISARRRQPAPAGRQPMGDETAPEGVDVLLARDKWSVEPLLRASRPGPGAVLGLPVAHPAVGARGAAGSARSTATRPCCRAIVGRSRMAWAFRDGDGQFGVTWHRMDAELDTGPILAQAPVPMLDDDYGIDVVGPRMGAVALGLLPEVFATAGGRRPGRPAADRGGHLGGALRRRLRDRRLVASRLAGSTTRCAPGPSPSACRRWSGPIAELDGTPRSAGPDHPHRPRRRRAAGGGRRREPIWIVESEPLD